jgi:hypothetical protein
MEISIMSKIQEQLSAATDCTPSKRKNESITDQDYMLRLLSAIADLPDAEWKKLPVPAQDWYNDNSDNVKAGKAIAPYPDVEPPLAPRGRRAEAKKEAAVGDTVSVKTKRGKEITGELTVLDKEGLVIKEASGKEHELGHDSLDGGITVVGGNGGGTAAEPEVMEPEVSDTVEVVTARKTVVGNILEIDEKGLVIKDSTGKEHEFDKENVKSVTVKVKNAKGAAPANGNKTTTTVVTKTVTSTATATDDKPKKITAATNGGVSATQRMREMICSDMEAKKDVIAATLKKEGLEFKQATLDLIYGDSHKLIGILRDLKKLK